MLFDVHWPTSSVKRKLSGEKKTFVRLVSPDANINKIIDQCFQKKLQGKIVGQTADKRFILQSDQIQKIFIDTNAIK